MPNARLQSGRTTIREAALPFGGLGIGLDVAIEAAAALRLRELPDRRKPAAPPTVDRPFAPSGYLLLTALGREIRGR